MSEFPVQISKIQAPPLRDETLARDRLLDWLAAKVHDRVVLLTAEAGYGKTTLLADFSRRTRLRSLWYRLDRGDRDWVGFIAHLAAAVRAHVAGFGPATDTLLRETASAAPPLDAVLDTFIRELVSLPSDPSVLILDDFHLVDDTPEIRHVIKELIARAPERVTFIFASRRTPPIPLARLRALGEVAELGTDELRFETAETERLFRETYEMPLDTGLIAELSRRTEGWAASLQLVRAALHDRDATQTRAFIGSLSGAEGHLYDYLAEEVVGDLPGPLQDFLMRTAILETIDPELGSVAAAIPRETVKALIDEGERLGLFSRRGLGGRHQVRAHPLVREFLQARLARSLDPTQVAEIHRDVAACASATDWRLAAHHFIAGGAEDQAREVLSTSIDRILATGAYATAHELVGSLADRRLEGSSGLILESRMAMLDADPESGLELAERALRDSPTSGAAALNVITARSFAGDNAGAVQAGMALEESGDQRLKALARTFRLVLETSVSGSVALASAEIDAFLPQLVQDGDAHFLGIAYLNQASLRIAMADPEGALDAAERAISSLQSTSAGVELTSARLARAIALSYIGDLSAARREAQAARSGIATRQRVEGFEESAAVEVAFGDEREADRLLEAIRGEIREADDSSEQALLVRARLSLRRGDSHAARADLCQIQKGTIRTLVAFEAQRLIAEAELQLLEGEPQVAHRKANAAELLSARQGANHWTRVATLLKALTDPGASADDGVRVASQEDPSSLSVVAEPLLARLGELSPEARQLVGIEAGRRPDRWRPSLRRLLEADDIHLRRAAAPLLEAIGEPEDIRLLRSVSRSIGGAGESHARALARRLAPRVLVDDLGRVRLHVGTREVEGSDVRRKVLALLCFLITRPRFSSTREEVLDAMWPELDPASALNSLNQTVYFLRRVFEPNYRDAESPGYLRQDAETIWLDPELVDARSRQCWALISEVPRATEASQALELSQRYVARFALDFAYEEWASVYRDSLHAAYLRVVEQAIRLDLNAGAFARAIQIAERASTVDPEAEDIQVALIRLYRLAGAFAAAAEQYEHYSIVQQGLGLEPTPFEVVAGGPAPIGTPAY